MIYLGIDPGVSGALAVIDGNDIRLFDVPTRKAKVGTEYCAGEMADLLHTEARPLGVTIGFVTIETVSIRPGESGRSALKIGRGAGLWEGVIAGARIPYETTPAAVWKREFSLLGCDKKASRARAQELFPHIRELLAKKRPDFSEALLLAEYGRRRQARAAK